MPMINVAGLTFAYEGGRENIFENVSFRIDTDWKLGFTGRNGRGKTTFLNLLLGKYEYSGSITISGGSAGFEYFPYAVPDESGTARAVVRGIAPGAPDWMIDRELSLIGLPEDARGRGFSDLSGGERNKALLAGLFLREDAYLLIDEPTNHLDERGRESLAVYLKSKRGYILVSHDRAFLDDCTDHILSINRANIEVQRGNFSSWWENKRRQDEYELAGNRRLKGEIKRLAEASRRAAEWSDAAESSKSARNIRPGSGPGMNDRGYVGRKAAKMMSRSKSIEARKTAAIDEKSSLLNNIESSDELKISQEEYHSNVLVSASDLSFSYAGERNKGIRPITLTVERGERVFLTGGNGSGKSSILKLICGDLRGGLSHSGELRVGSGLIISYVPQSVSFLSGSLSAYAALNALDESLFKAVLRKLDFSREQFEKDMADFSEGQKKKTLIARSLCERAHLRVWDEPLNFVDVFSRIQIEKLLLKFKPTMLIVEHDRKFRENTATKTQGHSPWTR